MTDTTIDPMTADIQRMVGALVRHGLRERGETADLERFRQPDSWTVVLDAETYIIRWRSDHKLLCTIPLETVAAAVGLLRAKRGDALPDRLN